MICDLVLLDPQRQIKQRWTNDVTSKLQSDSTTKAVSPPQPVILVLQWVLLYLTESTWT